MSDPTALNIPVTQALTSQMLLGLLPSAPKSRSYRLSVAPLNKSTFVGGDQIIFEIPTGRKGTWLDQQQSYIKFSVQCASTAAASQGGSGIYVDNTAYSFFQRLDIYNSSNLLETVNQYSDIANLLLDTSLTMSDKAGLSTLIGCNPYNTTYQDASTEITNAVVNGAVTSSTSVTIGGANNLIVPGQIILGGTIPAGTTVSAINATTLTLSNTATLATGTQLSFFNALPQTSLSNNLSFYYQGAIAGLAVPYSYVLQQPGDRSGLSMTSVATASGINTAIPYTFTLPILSSVIGVNSSKMLPLGQLNAPIRCEFYLSTNDDAIYYGTAGAGATWQLVNVEMVLCYVEIQDDNFNLPQGETEYITTTTYRHASTYLPSATSGEFTTLLPFRCASLTGLYARFRNFASATQGANGTAAYRKGSSICPNFSSFYFRIGSSIYPNKPIYLQNGTLVGNYAEAYAELLKSFHMFSSSIGNSALTYNMYNVAATSTNAVAQNFVPASASTNAGTCNNSFAIGLECQSISNRSDVLLSGISTLNSQIYFTGVVGGTNAGGTNGYNYVMDFWAAMDSVLVIENGIMRAIF